MKELYIVSKERIEPHRFLLVGEEARHCTKVMRHNSGDRIFVTDGEGVEYEGIIQNISADYVECKLLNKKRKPRESLTEVTLGFGILKHPRIEFLVEKATELGVFNFIPLITKYTIPTWNFEEKRIARLQRIIRSAVKQSLRSWIPKISLPIKFDELIIQSPQYSTVLLAHPGEKKTLGRVLKEKPGKKILLLIGPEGGFSKEEIEKAKDYGVKLFSLGDRRLRAETAAIAALANINYISET